MLTYPWIKANMIATFALWALLLSLALAAWVLPTSLAAEPQRLWCLGTDQMSEFIGALDEDIVTVAGEKITIHAEVGDVVWTWNAGIGLWCSVH